MSEIKTVVRAAIAAGVRKILVNHPELWLIGMDIDPLEDAVFPNVKSILVYPAGFVAPTARQEAVDRDCCGPCRAVAICG